MNIFNVSHIILLRIKSKAFVIAKRSHLVCFLDNSSYIFCYCPTSSLYSSYSCLLVIFEHSGHRPLPGMISQYE